MLYSVPFLKQYKSINKFNLSLVLALCIFCKGKKQENNRNLSALQPFTMVLFLMCILMQGINF